MSKFELKNKVELLRRRGLSISEIVHDLGISKSTVSLWCRDIFLSETQKQRLFDKMIKAGHKGRILGALTNRHKKENSILTCNTWAKEIISSLSERDMLIAGVSLYWAEGSKSMNGNLSFVNSDPKMVLFMYKWFQKVFGLVREDFIIRIYINEIHNSRIEKVLIFWSHLLDFPQDLFRKTVYVKARQRKVYTNHDSYYGLLTIRIRKSSLIKYKILAMMELIRNADVAQVARASHS